MSGQAPGFANVEAWDDTHSHPPLAAATPDSDGNFSMVVDTTKLGTGATTWATQAWDVPAGETPNHSDAVDVKLTLDAGTSSPPSTPLPSMPPQGGDTSRTPQSPVSGTYYLTFDDEFDGLSSQNPDEDTNRSPTETSRGWWRPIYNWGGSSETYDSRYVGASEAHNNAGSSRRFISSPTTRRTARASADPCPTAHTPTTGFTSTASNGSPTR